MVTIRMIMLCMASVLLSSCSIYMAAQQPEKKNFAVLTKGTPQTLVRAEFGLPAWSGKDEDNEVDIFQFVQGYPKGSKVTRAVGHGLADIFTFGLWEIVGTPIEMFVNGTKMKATITYDDQHRVKTVRLHDIKGNEIPLQKPREKVIPESDSHGNPGSDSH